MKDTLYNELKESKHIYIKHSDTDIDSIVAKKQIDDDKIMLVIKDYQFAGAKIGFVKRYSYLRIKKDILYTTDNYGFYMVDEYTLKAL
ncbi:hypothetical protein KDD93_09145 [Campylobacter sp. faydin G-24]|uniref:Uncharacterized protein n=1 Tax=Campylobacter anatolicus TaxID=2829105 RepID=A0ABS5HKX1_9BACT|nr:hypothetical protein [Campylobacter anatolicus]MBR8464720.1 hypothetical protein [Campylobacter anatolicus]